MQQIISIGMLVAVVGAAAASADLASPSEAARDAMLFFRAIFVVEVEALAFLKVGLHSRCKGGVELLLVVELGGETLSLLAWRGVCSVCLVVVVAGFEGGRGRPKKWLSANLARRIFESNEINLFIEHHRNFDPLS
jgi:hypothetical protein